MSKAKTVKPLRKIKIKYPEIDSKNKALYKAVSHIPTVSTSNLPVAYIKSLPMIIGVITVLVFIFVSQNNFNHFKNKTKELGDYVSLSMRAGVSAYVDQLERYVKPLPVDTKVEPKLYSGRIESNKFSKLNIELGVIAENTHLMTARVSSIFDNF